MLLRYSIVFRTSCYLHRQLLTWYSSRALSTRLARAARGRTPDCNPKGKVFCLQPQACQLCVFIDALTKLRTLPSTFNLISALLVLLFQSLKGLNYFKYSFCIYQDDNVLSILHFINTIYSID